MVNKSEDLGMDAAHTGGMKKKQQMKRRRQRRGGGAGGYCAAKNNSGLLQATVHSLFPSWMETFLNGLFFSSDE